jgi:sec-independent protein translocase protein TatA
MDFHLMRLSAALIFDSPMDIGVVLVIVLILFGGKKIPEVMRGLGQGIREFKGGMRDEQPPTTTTTTSQAAPPTVVTTTPTVEKK